MLTETLSEGLDACWIGPKIRALRRQKGLALSEFGAQSGPSPEMLPKIERGRVFPTLPTRLRIGMVFGIGLDHFFRPEEERPMFEITRAGERLVLPDQPEGEAAHWLESLDFAAGRRGFEGFIAEFPARGRGSKPHEHAGEELV